MELHSYELELRALRSVTYSRTKERVRVSMLGRVSLNHFANDVTRRAFRRISKLCADRGELLDWEDLLEDSNLSAEVRDYLRDANDVKAVKTTDRFERIVSQLDKYRKRRYLADMGRGIADILESKDSEEFDEDSYLRTLADQLNNAHAPEVDKDVVWSFGKGSNITQLVKNVLYKPSERMYKTGYKLYDDKNGGLPTTGVMLLAGATSSGKSVLSMNLMRQLHELNSIDVLKVTLEMTAEQEMNRILSMISGVPFNKIKQQKLTDREKEKVLKAAKKFNAECKARKARFSYSSPTQGMSIDDVLYRAMAYNVKVLCIDYVSLLEGVDDDNQWRKLSEIVRKAKIFASRTGALVVILCQLDDESGKIRYSKGMREHADVVWAWNYSDPEVRATRHIPVEVIKVRDGELMLMPLKEAFDMMIVGNPDGEAPVPEFKKKESKFKSKGGGGDAADKDDKARRRRLIDSATIADDDEEKSSKKKKKKPGNRYLVE